MVASDGTTGSRKLPSSFTPSALPVNVRSAPPAASGDVSNAAFSATMPPHSTMATRPWRTCKGGAWEACVGGVWEVWENVCGLV
eukprot:9606-Chlamydomonas_euryale.AAC.2